MYHLGVSGPLLLKSEKKAFEKPILSAYMKNLQQHMYIQTPPDSFFSVMHTMSGKELVSSPPFIQGHL